MTDEQFLDDSRAVTCIGNGSADMDVIKWFNCGVEVNTGVAAVGRKQHGCVGGIFPLAELIKRNADCQINVTRLASQHAGGFFGDEFNADGLYRWNSAPPCINALEFNHGVGFKFGDLVGAGSVYQGLGSSHFAAITFDVGLRSDPQSVCRTRTPFEGHIR